MLEKTLNARKKIILLRSFFAIVVVLSFVLGFVFPISAEASSWNDPIDYRDLDYKVTYGTDYNKVVVPLPVSHYYMAAYDMPPLGDGGMISESFGTDSFTYDYVKGRNYRIFAYPGGWRGFSLEGMPAGTRLHFDLLLTVHSYKDLVIAGNLDLFERSYYLVNGEWKNIKNELVADLYGWGMPISLDFSVDGYNGASSFVCGAMIEHFSAYDYAEVTIVMSNVRLEMDVSVDYWTQWQNEQNGKLLGDIKGELEDVNDNLGDVNDKLEDTNEKLDELPGEIGDEMQGVIDKEKDEAQASGNKFVNQILDKLPDPSTEVLTALKKLTDATAYTGTDAKLSIPAIVIPEIAGLIPETELWGGTEFSFSDYLSFLPSTLLTVVQSLFTIAIVLFCVYELKGIISYCLTLNDKKGG